jgi:hypothetical protein
VTETRRAIVWGALFPALILMLGLFSKWALLLFGIYPAQVLRLSRWMPFEQALFLTLAKFPEAQGVLEFSWHRLRNRQRGIIEYK